MLCPLFQHGVCVREKPKLCCVFWTTCGPVFSGISQVLFHWDYWGASTSMFLSQDPRKAGPSPGVREEQHLTAMVVQMKISWIML